ncbi:hypothetical protein AAFF_G00038920 [Aldrovandia affinis]|uniref:Uncharacterized protein n=1 Tax=Aldrovandia affinis TaxID=143900 RepID=A0AAD7WZG1_9TELE|nr:hypothetical protein AAFF_G00038920 [Aldrovandia affinis]
MTLREAGETHRDTWPTHRRRTLGLRILCREREGGCSDRRRDPASARPVDGRQRVATDNQGVRGWTGQTIGRARGELDCDAAPRGGSIRAVAQAVFGRPRGRRRSL